MESDISKNEIKKEEKIKRNRKRPSKAERYSEERKKIIEELEKKMGISEEIRGVLLYDLEKNVELKKYIKEKIPEIKKIYKTGNWNYFVKQHKIEGEEVSEISIIKSIYKDEKYKIKTMRKMIEKEGIKKQHTCIFFYKEYEITEKIKT